MAISIKQRLISGDQFRKSRFHDVRGNRVGLWDIVTDLGPAIAGSVTRRLVGKYRPEPWIPYPAIRRLEQIAQPDWRVLEHGAGMSTIWWSRRVARVHAIEADAQWFARIEAQIKHGKHVAVELELRTGSHYTDFSMFADHSFELMCIDGHAREIAAREAARLVTRPGYIYLDNTDFAAVWHEMYGEAEHALRTVANGHRGKIEYFTGFAGGTAVASQGMLVTLPGN